MIMQRHNGQISIVVPCGVVVNADNLEIVS